MIRDMPVYRRDAFVQGLRTTGFDVMGNQDPQLAEPGDVLVTWNRYDAWHRMCEKFEARGGTVLIAENAYCANSRSDRQRYALAREGHNGQGWWYQGGSERWDALGIEIKSWRSVGHHVLVCPNRSFGRPGFIMPMDWAAQAVAVLKKHTNRPIKVRQHPGNGPHQVPLENDLKNAWAVVVWSSSVGVDAMIAGIPVFCCAPAWICRGAAETDLSRIEFPTYTRDRKDALAKLAWAQWTVEEIRSGGPFQHLCHEAPAFAGRV